MSKEPMPATEADVEVSTYEVAFHVLPTVAEGEVASVVDTIKSHITTAGGTITGEETPARFELAYEIVKHLEGRNRRFTSAYFGWIRFSAGADDIEALAAEIDGTKEILRSMLIKLNKVEEANPFMFHESIADRKVETVDVSPEALAKDEEQSEESSEEKQTETDDEEAVDGEEKE